MTKIDLEKIECIIMMAQCPWCKSTNMTSIKVTIGYNKGIQAWKCNKCNEIILDGETLKRPKCPKCGKTMGKNGYTKILDINIPRWYYSTCRFDLTLLIKKLMREAKTPPCPKCGHEHTRCKGISRGEKKYFCPNCKAHFMVPRMNPTERSLGG